MAKKNKKPTTSPGKPVGAPPPKPGDDGFEELDDFFFGSATGQFARDEFDYDPFEDVKPAAKVEGPEALDTAGSIAATRMGAVPSQVRREAEALRSHAEEKPGKSLADTTRDAPVAGKIDPAEPTKPHGRSEPTKSEAKAEPTKAEPTKAGSMPEPKPDGPKADLRSESTKAEATPDPRPEPTKAVAKAEQPQAEAPKTTAKVEQPKAAAKAQPKGKSAGSVPTGSMRAAPPPIADTSQDDSADTPSDAVATADVVDLPAASIAPAVDEAPPPAPTTAKRRTEPGVPLSERRAAGAAAAAAMSADIVIGGGDDEGTGEAVDPAAGAADDSDDAEPPARDTQPDLDPPEPVVVTPAPETRGLGGRVRDAAELVQEAVARTAKKDAAIRADLLFEAGRALALEGSDRTAATTRFEEALSSQPNHLPALRELVRAVVSRKDWGRALDLLGRQAKAAGTPAGETAALLASANIRLSEVDGQRSAAEDDLRRALAVCPDNFTALRYLRVIHYEAQDWPKLVSALKSARDLADPGEALRIDYELARIADEVLADPAESLAALRRCLQHDPRFLPAILDSERLLTDASDAGGLVAVWRAAGSAFGGPDGAFFHARAARLGDSAGLSPDEVASAWDAAIGESPTDALREEHRHWLETRGRWDEFLVACERDAADAEPRLRAHLLAAAGRVALQHFGDRKTAATLFERALSADPGSLDAQEGRRQVLIAAGDHAGLLALLEQSAEASAQPRTRLALRLKAAEVAADRLTDLEAARKHLEAACLQAPNYLPALDALVEVLGRSGDHAARAERLEQGSALVDSGEARACYLLRAALAWSLAGNRDRHVNALRRSADDGPGSLFARELLVETLSQDGRSADAAELLRQAAAESQDAALKVSLLYRAARLALSRADDPDVAEAAYRALLDVVPDFLPAALDLRDLLLARGDWDSHGLLLQQEAESAQSQDARAAWHVAAAQSYERAGRSHDAARQLVQALQAAPADAVAQSALRRLQRSSQDHAWLAKSLGDAVAASPTGASALRLQRVASLLAIGDPAPILAQCKLLTESPADDTPLLALGALCEGLQGLAEAADAYGASAARGGTHRAVALFQRGLLREEGLSDGDGAVRDYLDADDAAGNHPVALESLERIYARSGKREELAAIYLREAQRAARQPVRTFYALLAGDEFERLGNGAHAVTAYALAFADLVGRDRAWDALRRLLEGRRDAAALLEYGQPVIDASTGPDATARAMELADALLLAGGAAQAATVLDALLDSRPDYLPAALLLERACDGRGDADGALRALELATASATSESLRALLDARTQERLSRGGATSNSAFEYYKKLLERDANQPVALRGLSLIALERGDLDSARKHLEALATVATEPGERADASAQLGRLLLARGGAEPEAIARFEQALKDDATCRPALDALRELHRKSGNWQALVGVLARESSSLPPDRRVPVFAEIARIWQDHIGNAKVAISSWEKVLQGDPGHKEALSRLESLYEQLSDWKGYITIAERSLAELSGPALRERLTHLGRVAWERAGAADQAIAWLRQASSGDDPSVAALAELRRIYQARGDWEQVIALAERQSDLLKSDKERAALLLEAATIRLDQLLDREGAARLFERVLALDPADTTALRFFVDFHFDADDWERALPVFERYAATVDAFDPDDDDLRMEATGFYFKLGTVQARLEKLDSEMLASWARALELTPTHLPSLEAAAPRYLASKDWGRARDAYRAILRLQGGTGDASTLTSLYMNLGKAEMELQDDKNAAKRFKKVLELSPNHVEALQGVARVHWNAGDWNSLLSAYNSIIKYARDPDQVIQAYMTKGDVLEQKLQFTDKAVLHYEKVLMYDKHNVAAMARLGQIALRKGDATRAGEFARSATKAARLPGEKQRALLLERLAAAGDEVAVDAVLDEVKRLAADGGAVTAFTAALGNRRTAPRAEVAAAFVAALDA